MSIRGDVLNQEIKSVYIDMIHVYATDEDDNVIYILTADTTVTKGKNYFSKSGNTYTVASLSEGSNPAQLGLYEERGAYFNSSSEFITFQSKQYLPAAFSMTEPDRTSVNEETGSLTVVGVPTEYMEMIQEDSPKIYMECSLVKYDELSSGLYILDPVNYEVKSVTMSSANASVSIALKGGGLLGYYVSKDVYGTTNFPGLNC